MIALKNTDNTIGTIQNWSSATMPAVNEAGQEWIEIPAMPIVERPYKLVDGVVVHDAEKAAEEAKLAIRQAIVTEKLKLAANAETDAALGLEPSEETKAVEAKIAALVAEYREL